MENAEFNYESLEMWKVACEIRQEVKVLSQSFPESEKFKLTDQIIRSSRSVTANIAEGYGRYHYSDSVKFFYQARGSMSETLDHLILACEEKYIQQSVLDLLRLKIRSFFRLLNGYIKYKKKKKSSG